MITKYLKKVIDNKLMLNDHIKYTRNKILKSIGILYKCKQFLNKQTLRNHYFAI